MENIAPSEMQGTGHGAREGDVSCIPLPMVGGEPWARPPQTLLVRILLQRKWGYSLMSAPKGLPQS